MPRVHSKKKNSVGEYPCGDKQSGPTRCIKHGNIICDYIYATDLKAAKKIAKERAK